eukprot:TRINITY_DN3282_c0_g1_i6.p1 TRINITY_DN3282_c0_g1~~TRINITY_DN3282_c0_g1_i6.p1  ORF type:complete len:310 (-),score=56.78 TRINITY_DN3282_c0_g1_i6:665-1594(-)
MLLLLLLLATVECVMEDGGISERVAQALEQLQLDPAHVLNVYVVGSRVWGTAMPDSDLDLAIVMDTTYTHPDGELMLSTKDIDAYVCNRVIFEEGLVDHILFHLMCLCLPSEHVWLQREPIHETLFSLDRDLSLPQLRASVSAEAARTWCKAMKKWNLEDNIPLSKKDIIHALRELLFGLQMAQHHRIIDFTAANEYHERMRKEESTDWPHYKAAYHPIYNDLGSQLRQLAPKDDTFTPRREHLKNPRSAQEVEERVELVARKRRELAERQSAWEAKERARVAKLHLRGKTGGGKHPYTNNRFFFNTSW